MEITVTIDDDLYELALEMAEPSVDKSNILVEALKEFIRVQTLKKCFSLDSMQMKMQIESGKSDEPVR